MRVYQLGDEEKVYTWPRYLGNLAAMALPRARARLSRLCWLRPSENTWMQWPAYGFSASAPLVTLGWRQDFLGEFVVDDDLYIAAAALDDALDSVRLGGGLCGTALLFGDIRLRRGRHIECRRQQQRSAYQDFF